MSKFVEFTSKSGKSILVNLDYVIDVEPTVSSEVLKSICENVLPDAITDLMGTTITTMQKQSNGETTVINIKEPYSKVKTIILEGQK